MSNHDHTDFTQFVALVYEESHSRIRFGLLRRLRRACCAKRPSQSAAVCVLGSPGRADAVDSPEGSKSERVAGIHTRSGAADASAVADHTGTEDAIHPERRWIEP